MAASTGRPKVSPVREKFEYKETENESVCCIIKNDGSVCGGKVKGKNATNLKQHLASTHKNEHKEVLEKEELLKSQKKSKSSFGNNQLALTSILKKKTLSKDKHKSITTKLALFTATASVPHSIVENVEFRELLLQLEPSYSVPGRKTICEEISRIVTTVKEKISLQMSLARQLHFSCDIWTKKGMSESFLGIVVHFFASKKKQHATLAVRNIYGSHTAENVLSIFKEVINEWGIHDDVIGKVLTDNGSNMLKAFRLLKEDLSCTENDVANTDAEVKQISLVDSCDSDNEIDNECDEDETNEPNEEDSDLQ
jgi:hypothetical protein